MQPILYIKKIVHCNKLQEIINPALHLFVNILYRQVAVLHSVTVKFDH